jgi:hypothetical protein
MSTPEEQRHRAALIEMARDLGMAVEDRELSSDEALEVFETLKALLWLLSVPPRAEQH